MKFQIQLAVVETAFAGARILSGTISAGYSQVIPSHPTICVSHLYSRDRSRTLQNLLAKNVLNPKRNTVEAIPDGAFAMEAVIAKITIHPDMPAAPNNINFRRPIFSIVKTAIHDARKYSVPLHAAINRERKSLRPTSFCRTFGR